MQMRRLNFLRRCRSRGCCSGCTAAPPLAPIRHDSAVVTISKFDDLTGTQWQARSPELVERCGVERGDQQR